jgi:hypothetical protein
MGRWTLLILLACVLAVAVSLGLYHFQTTSVPFPTSRTPAAATTSLRTVAAPGTGTTRPFDLFKVFADAPPMDSAQISMQDLQQTFPAFQHEPFDKAGFDAVTLPFSYSDPGGIGNPNEAQAMAALVSNDLHWSPA